MFLGQEWQLALDYARSMSIILGLNDGAKASSRSPKRRSGRGRRFFRVRSRARCDRDRSSSSAVGSPPRSGKRSNPTARRSSPPRSPKPRDALVDVGGFTGIFADTKLADGTGFDVLERDRALDRDTPALAVSHRKRDWRPESLRAFDCRAEFIVAPVQSRLFVVCVKRWDEQQAKDEAEDELFIQTHAANIGQTPEQVKAEVQSLLAKTGARTLAALARRFRWEVARRAPKWDPSPTRH